MTQLITFDAKDIGVLANFLSQYDWNYHSKPKITPQEVQEKAAKDYYCQNPDLQSFWIEHEGEKVGFIRLFDLGDSPDSSETPLFDIRMGVPWRGKGIGTAALRLLVDYVFSNFPNKNRIEATTRHDNYAMRKVLERAGFQKEAHYRQAWGDKQDAVGYAILRQEWTTKTPIVVKFMD